jgi:hypothetical protein
MTACIVAHLSSSAASLKPEHAKNFYVEMRKIIPSQLGNTVSVCGGGDDMKGIGAIVSSSLLCVFVSDFSRAHSPYWESVIRFVRSSRIRLSGAGNRGNYFGVCCTQRCILWGNSLAGFHIWRKKICENIEFRKVFSPFFII